MYKIILISLALVFSSTSFARGHGPKFDDNALAAIENCGLELPQRGERPTRETREAVRNCLSEAGFEIPERKRRRRGQRSQQENFESSSID